MSDTKIDLRKYFFALIFRFVSRGLPDCSVLSKVLQVPLRMECTLYFHLLESRFAPGGTKAALMEHTCDDDSLATAGCLGSSRKPAMTLGFLWGFCAGPGGLPALLERRPNKLSAPYFGVAGGEVVIKSHSRT